MPWPGRPESAEHLLASQRKFTEDLLNAKPEGAVARTYEFAEQPLASQRKFAEAPPRRRR